MSFIDFEELKAKVVTEDVLSMLQPDAPITRSGADLRTCCPIHGGKNPNNFSINSETGVFNCFSRGCSGGDVISLLAQVKGLDVKEAAGELNEWIVGGDIKLAERIDRDGSKKKTKDKGYTFEDTKRCWEEAEDISGSFERRKRDTYFLNKGLFPPAFARFGRNPMGYPSTLVPFKNIDGELEAVLSLGKAAKHIFKAVKDYKKAFALFGELCPDGAFYFGEGIATIQTAWEAFNREIPAVSCGSRNNMTYVLGAIMDSYPNIRPIVLLDRDDSGEGLRVARQIKEMCPAATFRLPSFEGLPNPNNEKLTDFNDLISKCKKGLDAVKEQLEVEFEIEDEPIPTTEQESGSKESLDTREIAEAKYISRLGELVGDNNFAEALRARTYEEFLKDHKRLFNSGGLITGFESLDERLYFGKGDFVVIQAMSNHGKTTAMLQLAHGFLTVPKNQEKEPFCLFVTYESSTVAIEQKLFNLITHENEEKNTITYHPNSDKKFYYPEPKEALGTVTTFNEFLKDKFLALKPVNFEKLKALITTIKDYHPDRLIVLFLDYIQIIHDKLAETGWERIKTISKGLERIAIEHEIIIVTGSQVNDKRQTREGRDIYNYATTILDILNHSHPLLKMNGDTSNLYKEKVGGKSLITLSAVKQKHGELFTLTDGLLFNGFHFEEKNRISNSNNFQL